MTGHKAIAHIAEPCLSTKLLGGLMQSLADTGLVQRAVLAVDISFNDDFTLGFEVELSDGDAEAITGTVQ